MPNIRDQLEPLIREVGIREVSRRSGVPHSRIHDWLSGRRRMYVDRLESLARAVGRPLQLRPKRGDRKTKAP